MLRCEAGMRRGRICEFVVWRFRVCVPIVQLLGASDRCCGLFVLFDPLVGLCGPAATALRRRRRHRGRGSQIECELRDATLHFVNRDKKAFAWMRKWAAGYTLTLERATDAKLAGGYSFGNPIDAQLFGINLTVRCEVDGVTRLTPRRVPDHFFRLMVGA